MLTGFGARHYVMHVHERRMLAAAHDAAPVVAPDDVPTHCSWNRMRRATHVGR